MAETATKQFTASAKRIRMSARKARLVMDIVRGRNALEASMMLQFVNKRAAPYIRKVIDSAIANAEEYANRSGVDVDTEELVISKAWVDEGIRMKRWRPRSRGSAAPYTRYTCHLNVVLSEESDDDTPKKPEWRKKRRRMSREERLRKVGREDELKGESGSKKAESKKTESKAAKEAPKESAKETKKEEE